MRHVYDKRSTDVCRLGLLARACVCVCVCVRVCVRACVRVCRGDVRTYSGLCVVGNVVFLLKVTFYRRVRGGRRGEGKQR